MISNIGVTTLLHYLISEKSRPKIINISPKIKRFELLLKDLSSLGIQQFSRLLEIQ